MIAETDEKTRSQQSDVPVFVVIKEDNELAPVEMIKGECSHLQTKYSCEMVKGCLR